MTRAKLIAAMPVGSKWNGFHQQGGRWVELRGGERTVEAHKSGHMTLARAGEPQPAILDYPRRRDHFKADENTVEIGFTYEDGEVWSRVKYERVKPA